MVTRSNLGGSFEDAVNAMKIPGVSGEKPEIAEANRMLGRPITDQEEIVVPIVTKRKKQVTCPSCSHSWTEEI